MLVTPIASKGTIDTDKPVAPLSFPLPPELGLELGSDTGELLSTPFEVLVVVGTAFNPPLPYGHPTKSVPG